MKTALFVSLVLALSAALPARADIDSMRARVPKIVELKDKGVIGEMPDGLLGVVTSEGDAPNIVSAENSDRMDEYKKRATTQGQNVDTLMKVLGEARIRNEKPGRFIKSASGGWGKK